MSAFMRLGVSGAAVRADGSVLLTRRSDTQAWALPSGGLRDGDMLEDATVREVAQATGVLCTVRRAVGLYYWAGLQRLTVLFAAEQVGGEVDNPPGPNATVRYFRPGDMPTDVLAPRMVRDALRDGRPAPRVFMTPPAERRAQRVREGLQAVQRALRVRGGKGARPTRFSVRAVGVFLAQGGQRVFTLPGDGPVRVLPFARCNGAQPPWHDLAQGMAQHVALDPTQPLRWVGYWQHLPTNTIELVFAASVPEASLRDDAQWTVVRNAPLLGRDAAYLGYVLREGSEAPVWKLVQARDERGPSQVRVQDASELTWT